MRYVKLNLSILFTKQSIELLNLILNKLEKFIREVEPEIIKKIENNKKIYVFDIVSSMTARYKEIYTNILYSLLKLNIDKIERYEKLPVELAFLKRYIEFDEYNGKTRAILKFPLNSDEFYSVKYVPFTEIRHCEGYSYIKIPLPKNINKNDIYAIKIYKQNNNIYAEIILDSKYEYSNVALRKYNRRYYEKHKDKFKQYNKKYYQKHKDKFTEYRRKYKQRNKEKIIEYNRKYYQQNTKYRLYLTTYNRIRYTYIDMYAYTYNKLKEMSENTNIPKIKLLSKALDIVEKDPSVLENYQVINDTKDKKLCLFKSDYRRIQKLQKRLKTKITQPNIIAASVDILYKLYKENPEILEKLH